jgi:uncharacterized protein with GYD domain
MKTYVMMSKKAPQGLSVIDVVRKMKSSPQDRESWIKKVEKECPNVRFLAHYALLGSWDFMDIYEAPDEETAAMVSMLCSDTTAFQVESWPAIPDDKIRELAARLNSLGD